MEKEQKKAFLGVLFEIFPAKKPKSIINLNTARQKKERQKLKVLFFKIIYEKNGTSYTSS